ncbi:MAG: LuxR C-terminal-related transcriptional regulator [Myxococcota bacterium]
MTTANPLSAPARTTALRGTRILVVQVRPSAALGIGAAVARARAHVHVCRSTHAALDVLRSGRVAFDAAALDGELPRPEMQAIAAALRSGANPCLAIGIGSPADPASIRRLVEAGVNELVVPPLTPAAILDALTRCVTATAELRTRLEEAPCSMQPMNPSASSSEMRRPAHWSPSTGVIPRHNPDIEHAVARTAKSASLSPREISVLKYIALGYRYDEIGEALSISGRTVKMHAANVRRKVGAPNRLALVRKVLAV